MDDNLSWRAQLARSNINILNIEWSDDRVTAEVFFEFMYRPYNGSIKWCKTWAPVAGKLVQDPDDPDDPDEIEYNQMEVSGDDICDTLRQMTLKLRKELER